MRWWAVALALLALPVHAEWSWVEEYDGPPIADEELAHTPPDLDVADVTALLAHLTGSKQLTGLRRQAGDTDADGEITVVDLLAVLGVVLGRVEGLYVADACESDRACEWVGGTPLVVADGGCSGGSSRGAPLPLRLWCVAWGDVAG